MTDEIPIIQISDLPPISWISIDQFIAMRPELAKEEAEDASKAGANLIELDGVNGAYEFLRNEG